MMPGTRYVALLLFLLAAAATRADSLALINANVFDGIADELREDVTVFVRDGRIERIAGNDAAVPAGYTVIDCEDYVLMPGLFDVHTHLDTLERARRALESGVTTVRTAGASAYEDVGLKAMADAGRIPGPDVVPAGVFVTPALGNTILADPRLAVLADGVNTDDELRLVVDVNADRGVGVIKTRGTQRAGLPDTDPRQQVYTERQLRVIVEAAARRGLPVMVHAHGDEGARAAVLAGARSIEHGTYLSDETIRLMAERGTYLVPTWVTMNEMHEEQYDYVLRLRARHMVPQLENAIRAAHAAGVPIATGADNYYDEKSTNRISVEVETLVRLGLTPFEALRSATAVSAELLGLGDVTGRIAAGYEADLILVPGDPLADVAVLQDVLMVVSNGRVAVKRIPFSR